MHKCLSSEILEKKQHLNSFDTRSFVLPLFPDMMTNIRGNRSWRILQIYMRAYALTARLNHTRYLTLIYAPHSHLFEMAMFILLISYFLVSPLGPHVLLVA